MVTFVSYFVSLNFLGLTAILTGEGVLVGEFHCLVALRVIVVHDSHVHACVFSTGQFCFGTFSLIYFGTGKKRKEEKE